MATRASTGLSLGSPFGIPVRVGASTMLLLVLAAFIGTQQATAYFGGAATTPAPVYGAVFSGLLFLSLLFHELCHCFAARASGLRVIGIRFEGIGGASEFSGASSRARQEAWIAFAGPLANIALAGVTYLATRSLDRASTIWLLCAELFYANAALAVFNLLPGLPLDGGRILAAGVWGALGDRATGVRAAARAGMGLAVLVGIFGVRQLASDGAFALWTLLIAFAIFGGARQALQASAVTEALPSLRARDLARTAVFVTHDVPLAEALRRAEVSGATAVVTVDSDGRAQGVMSGAFVDAVPPERRPWVTVGSVSRTLTPETVISVDLEGQQLVERLRDAGAGEYLLVSPDGGVAGVLSTVDLMARLRSLTA